MDLLESPAFSPPLILLQTVIDEVRHRSLPLYNRLRALSTADDKAVFVFYNEFRACVSLLSLYRRERAHTYGRTGRPP
jgi:exosome complex exonuclease DIS3/RRP44